MQTENACGTKVLHYLLLPVIAAAYLLLQWGKLEPVYLLRFEVLIIFGYIIALGDLREKRIPNTTLLVMLAAWVAISIPRLFLAFEREWQVMTTSLLGAGVAFAIFLTVYILSRKGLGGGDVKFITVVGLYLGLGGVIPAMLIGTILAAVVGLLLIALKRIDKKGTLPLAPFLYAGILVTIFMQ